MNGEEAWARRDEGVAKLFVVQRVLAWRRESPELFAAPYVPLDVGDDHLAFARGDDLVTVVPRFAAGPASTPTDLPPGPWVDVLAGLPVTLLTRP